MMTSAVHEARHVKLLAYAVVRKFLHDEGMEDTLMAFKAETSALNAFEELETHRVDLKLQSKPLMAILEEYIQDRVKEEAQLLMFNLGGGGGGSGAGNAVVDGYQRHHHSFSHIEDLPLLKESRSLEALHSSNILCVSYAMLPASLFTSSGQQDHTFIPVILTGSADKTLRLSHARTGALLARYEIGFSPLTVSFHPSCHNTHEATSNNRQTGIISPIFLVSGMDGSVRIYDVRVPQVLQTFKEHKKYCVRANFSPGSGDFLVTGGHDKQVNVYRRTSLTDVSSEYLSQDYDNDDSIIENNNVKVSTTWPTYTLEHSIPFHGAVESLTFIPNNNLYTPLESPIFIVGTREDNYLHFFQLTATSSKEPENKSKLDHTLWNMNTNNDDWVSFAPMDIAISPISPHMAVYTDSSTGRIAVYELPASPFSTSTADPTPSSSSARQTAAADISLLTLRPLTQQTLHSQQQPKLNSDGTPRLPRSPLTLVSDTYGVVEAGAFSRPSLVFASLPSSSPSTSSSQSSSSERPRKPVILATSDDLSLVVIDPFPKGGDRGDGVMQGKVVQKLVGHEKQVRGLCMVPGLSGSLDCQQVVVVTCSFDLSVRVWGV